jgi:hypothetical protein
LNNMSESSSSLAMHACSGADAVQMLSRIRKHTSDPASAW